MTPPPGDVERVASLSDRDIQQLENDGYSDVVDEILRLRRDNLDARLAPGAEHEMKDDTNGAGPAIASAWCVVDPYGKVEISSDWKTESDAWRIRLGWPTRGEVQAAKADGWKCIRVSIFQS